MSYLRISYFLTEKKESLDKGLEKTKESFFGKLGKAIVGKSTVDDEVLDNLEEILDFLRRRREYNTKNY